MEMKKKRKNQKTYNSVIPQGKECRYSFWDLYRQAHGKEMSVEEKNTFMELAQTEKNKKIKEWAVQVRWIYEDRIGSDGVTYTAFAPQ